MFDGDGDGEEDQGGSLAWGPGEAGDSEGRADSPAEGDSGESGDGEGSEVSLELDEVDEGDKGGLEFSSEDSEGDEEGDDSKKQPRAQKRIQQLVKQKKDAEGEAERLEGAIGELRTKNQELEDQIREMVEPAEGLHDAFKKLYGGFKDGLGQLAWDNSFVNAAEELMQGNEAVRNAVHEITKHMKGASMERSSERKESRQESKPAERKPDSQIEKLTKRMIQDSVKGFVKRAGVKPEFAKLMTKQMAAKVEDPDISDDDLLEKAKAVLKENGLSPKVVIAQREGKKGRPVSRSGGAAIQRGKAPEKGEDEGKGDGEKAPRNMQEFQARQRERARSLLDESRASA